jgi:hypothetical protein
MDTDTALPPFDGTTDTYVRDLCGGDLIVWEGKVVKVYNVYKATGGWMVEVSGGYDFPALGYRIVKKVV